MIFTYLIEILLQLLLDITQLQTYKVKSFQAFLFQPKFEKVFPNALSEEYEFVIKS